jgi:uncharacterized protein GlcG (DUF336 family)
MAKLRKPFSLVVVTTRKGAMVPNVRMDRSNMGYQDIKARKAISVVVVTTRKCTIEFVNEMG